jgi:hypothetical protein
VRIITPKGLFIEGEFTPEQLATIIERAGIEAEDSASTVLSMKDGVVEATPEEAAQLKAHPEELWVDTRPKRPAPEPEKPQSAVIGRINDTFDPDKGRHGFQFQMPPREE